MAGSSKPLRRMTLISSNGSSDILASFPLVNFFFRISLALALPLGLRNALEI
jgi:hypothetical protein